MIVFESSVSLSAQSLGS
ncbi:hypothetical protein D048_3546A, partial [Vibrio parahaemolyticus VPTS-2009]